MTEYRLVTIDGDSGWTTVPIDSLGGSEWLTIIPIRSHLTGCGSASDIVGQIGDAPVFAVGDGYDSPSSSAGVLRLAVNGACSGTVAVLVMVSAPDRALHEGPVEPPFNFATTDSEESAGRISLHNGEKRLSETDLILNTPAGPLTFTRSYRQGALEDYTFMGRGWTHNHHVLLFPSPPTSRVTLPHGGIGHYSYSGAGPIELIGGDVGKFECSDSAWTMTLPDRSSLVFEHAAAWGAFRLKERRWPGEEVWTYSYYLGIDNLKQVDAGHGRSLIFEYWNEEPYAGQLKQVSDHTGRTVLLNYTPAAEGCLLSEVIDVFGKSWQYEYDTGETESGLQDFLIERTSPSVDMTGDGTLDGPLTLERLTYQLSGETVDVLPLAITQEMGIIDESDPLFKTDLLFGAEQKNITTETIANRVSKHYFANGIYAGSRDASGTVSLRVGDSVGSKYRPSALINGNTAVQQVFWNRFKSDFVVCDNMARSIDALGATMQFTYDADGRLFMSVDAKGRPKTYLYTNTSQPRWPATILTGSSNLIQDGTMDNDPENPWVPIAGHEPTWIERSGSSGINYLSVGTSAIGQGIESNEFEVVAGKHYQVIALIQAGLGSVNVAITGTPGANMTFTQAEAWQTVSIPYTPSESGSVKLQFTAATSGSGSFSITNVAVSEIAQWEELTYNDSGLVLSHAIVDPADGTTVLRKVTNTYHVALPGAGLLATTSVHDRTNDSITLTRSFEYNNYGLVAKVTDEIGAVKLIGYEEGSRVVRVVESAATPDYPFLTDPELSGYTNISTNSDKDLITDYKYDTVGRLVETHTAVGTPQARCDLTVYDAMGRIIRTIDNYLPGVSSPYTAMRTSFNHGTNNDQNLISDVTYNARGLVSKKVDQAGVVTLFGYDDGDRLVKTVYNASNGLYNNTSYVDGDPDLSGYQVSSNLDQDIVTTYEYDNAGNLVKTVDPLGNVSFTVYDALNRPMKTVQSAKSEATIALEVGDISYSAANDPRSANYVPSLLADKDIITTRTYDAVGNVVKTVDPLGNMAFVVYDDLDRVIKTVRNAKDTATIDIDPDAPTYVADNDPRSDLYVASAETDRDIITRTVYENALHIKYAEDPMGVQTWVAYDGFNRAIKTILNPSVSDPRFQSYTPSSDADKDIITETVYNTLGQVEGVIDPLDRKTLYQYDAVGRVASTVVNAVTGGTDADQNVISRVYFDKLGRVTGQMDPLWNTTIHGYDGVGRRNKTNVNLSVDQPRTEYPDLDRITTVSYGLDSQPISAIDPAGVETRFEYDTARRRIRAIANHKDGIFEPDNTDMDVITHTAYNKAGLVTGVTDPRGGVARMDYDSALRPRAVTRPNGAVDWTRYDKAGQVIRVIQNVSYRPGDDVMPDDPAYSPLGHGDMEDRDLVSVIVRDRAGRVTHAVDPLNLATHMTYNKAGSLLSSIDAADVETRYVYDGVHRLVRVVKSYLNSGGIDPDTSKWIWNAGQTRWEDGSGVALPHGDYNDQNIITDITLDKVGHKIALTDPNGRSTLYIYDKLDRQRYVADPMTHTWETAYGFVSGGAGYRVTTTDPLGHQVVRETDRLGRPKSIMYGDAATPDVSFKYNQRGDLTRMTEKVNGSRIREAICRYDELHRVKTIDLDTNGNSATDQGVSYQYDASGLRTQMSPSIGPVINYDYDTSGHLTRMSGGPWAASFGYDGVDRLTHINRGGGFRSHYQYDAGSHLKSLRHFKGQMTYGEFTYSNFDALGNPLNGLEYVPHSGGSETTKFAHEALPVVGDWPEILDHTYRESTDPGDELTITSMQGTSAVITLGTGPDHGWCAILVSEDSSPISEQADVEIKRINTYAAVAGEREVTIVMRQEGSKSITLKNVSRKPGRTTITYRQIVLATSSDTNSLTYEYDAMGRLRLVDQESWTGGGPTYLFAYNRAGQLTQRAISGFGGSTTDYGYDAAGRLHRINDVPIVSYLNNGNMATDGILNFAWDRANKLSEVMGSAGTFQHRYNGLGQRVSQIKVNGGTTNYLFDGLSNMVIAEEKGGQQTHYVPGPMGIHAQQNANGDWIFPILDPHGSVRGAVNTSLVPLESRMYSPFGELTLTSGQKNTPLGYTGDYEDPSGLDYLGTYYNPVVSQPLSMRDQADMANRSGHGTLGTFVYAATLDAGHALALTLAAPVALAGLAILPEAVGMGALIGGGAAAVGYGMQELGLGGRDRKNWAQNTNPLASIGGGAVLGAVGGGIFGGLASLGTIGQYAANGIGLVASTAYTASAIQEANAHNWTPYDIYSVSLGGISMLGSGLGVLRAREQFFAEDYYQSFRGIDTELWRGESGSLYIRAGRLGLVLNDYNPRMLVNLNLAAKLPLDIFDPNEIGPQVKIRALLEWEASNPSRSINRLHNYLPEGWNLSVVLERYIGFRLTYPQSGVKRVLEGAPGRISQINRNLLGYRPHEAIITSVDIKPYPDPNVILGDLRNLYWISDNTFDEAFATSVFREDYRGRNKEFPGLVLSEKMGWVIEYARVLKPGGLLFATASGENPFMGLRNDTGLLPEVRKLGFEEVDPYDPWRNSSNYNKLYLPLVGARFGTPDAVEFKPTPISALRTLLLILKGK